MSDASAFSKKINSMLGVSSSTRRVEADVHQNASQAGGQDGSVYDWSEDPGTSDLVSPVAHSTPARREKRPAGIADDLPILFKKKKPVDAQLGNEEAIMAEVRRAYLGSAKVSTAHLTLGPKLRDLRESFVSELMVQMRAFPGHLYQPLCVIIDTLDDASLFRESNANGFHYKVIGGCHNFTAALRLGELDPSEEVFKSRMCSIYKNDLSEEAVLWLANQHNKVGEYRHHMSLTEKIQLCRHMFETVGKERENRSWHATISTILGDGHSKGVLKLLCRLAEMEDDSYNLLQRMLSLFGEGKLKGQKLSQDDLTKGPQMKPYILVELPSLPPVATQKLLQLLLTQMPVFINK